MNSEIQSDNKFTFLENLGQDPHRVLINNKGQLLSAITHYSLAVSQFIKYEYVLLSNTPKYKEDSPLYWLSIFQEQKKNYNKNNGYDLLEKWKLPFHIFEFQEQYDKPSLYFRDLDKNSLLYLLRRGTDIEYDRLLDSNYSTISIERHDWEDEKEAILEYYHINSLEIVCQKLELIIQEYNNQTPQTHENSKDENPGKRFLSLNYIACMVYIMLRAKGERMNFKRGQKPAIVNKIISVLEKGISNKDDDLRKIFHCYKVNNAIEPSTILKYLTPASGFHLNTEKFHENLDKILIYFKEMNLEDQLLGKIKTEIAEFRSDKENYFYK